MSLHWPGTGLSTRRGGTPPHQGNGVSHVFVEVNGRAIWEVIGAFFINKLVFFKCVLGQASGDSQVLVAELVVFSLRGLLSREGAQQQGHAQKDDWFHCPLL